MKRLALAFGTGLLFAIGLGISGMTMPAKVLAFLDIFGAWDPSLAFVMVGAIAAFASVTRLARRNAAPVYGGSFPVPVPERIDASLLTGAAIFGVGWGLVGLCPGPAVVSLATGDPKVIVFVAAMVGGALIFGRRRPLTRTRSR